MLLVALAGIAMAGRSFLPEFNEGALTVSAVTMEQVREIAQTKMEDLNANDMDAAMKIIEGSARSMGILVKD